jgi:hypothetical protein
MPPGKEPLYASYRWMLEYRITNYNFVSGKQWVLFCCIAWHFLSNAVTFLRNVQLFLCWLQLYIFHCVTKLVTFTQIFTRSLPSFTAEGQYSSLWFRSVYLSYKVTCDNMKPMPDSLRVFCARRAYVFHVRNYEMDFDKIMSLWSILEVNLLS